MIADSLQVVGAARSIVIDEDGMVLAGNDTIEAAAEVGIEDSASLARRGTKSSRCVGVG